MARQRLSRRHGAAHAAFRADRVHARRVAERNQPLRRRQDRLDAGRRAHVGDPHVRAVPGLREAWRARHDHPREQLRAVDRDGGRLHDHATHLRARRLHVGDQPGAADVADRRIHDRAVDSWRAGRVPDETSFHQRRAAPVSRGPRLRRGARCAVPQRRRRAGHAAGEGSDRRRHGCRPDQLPGRRELHEADPGAVAGIQLVLAPAHEARRLVLLARRARLRAVAEDRGSRHPAARTDTGGRLRDDRRRRPDGYPRGVEPAARCAVQFRGAGARNDLDR